MKGLLRKLRGVIGVGLTWGILWAAIGAVIGIVIGIADPGSMHRGESIPLISAAIGLLGLISGAAFGTLLSFTEGRKRIRDLSLGRVAVWGILGSAALPLLSGMQNSLIFITAPLGALFATASVVIARRAELRDWEEPKLMKSASLPDSIVN